MTEILAKIKNGMKIFTHCYSKTVLEILKQAKKDGKKFEVYNCEVRPKLLGRRMATALSKAGIKVTHMPDLLAPTAIKECNLFLFGVEKIVNKRVYNKIGTNTLLEAAKQAKIPAYACTHANKAEKPDKQRKNTPEQLWKSPPKNIKILNPGHEELNHKLITKIIAI